MKKMYFFIIFFILCFSPLFADSFRCIFNGNKDFNGDTTGFYRYNCAGDMLMLTADRGNKIILKELSSETTKICTPFSTGLDWDGCSLAYFLLDPPMFQGGGTGGCWIYSSRAFLRFENIKDNPKATKLIKKTQVPDMKETIYLPLPVKFGDYFNGVIIANTETESTNHIIYFAKQNALVKIDLNKPDTILLKVPFPEELFLMGENYCDMLYHNIDSLIWFCGYGGKVIACYNVYTQLLKTFDYNNLPLGKDFKIHSYFTMANSQLTGANTVFFLTDSSTFKLLIFNSVTKNWDVEDIGVPINSEIFDETKFPENATAFLWPFNTFEIAVCFRHYNSSYHNTRSFCIYNVKTKQWRDFIIPLDLFEGYSESTDYFLKPRQVSWLKTGKTIGILYDYFLIEYSPSAGDISDTDEGIFQEIGIRKIYPNPTSGASTADIMCYVQDLSKLDIGLYNLFGHKILDLNNNYSYNSLTHTISTTFKVPKGTPKGIYYLNVRKGTERRTQAIVIE